MALNNKSVHMRLGRAANASGGMLRGDFTLRAQPHIMLQEHGFRAPLVECDAKADDKQAADYKTEYGHALNMGVASSKINGVATC
ncbi:hypothetical protein [uncultured Lentibacter sp.]|uniref:hypothetical protein n=1 Tax=uncultured Lentibacter sp. TaxID=1659309 RepID=UPI00260E2EB8|nr:hypothetical protein [uncultured Lentibacter sp.]